MRVFKELVCSKKIEKIKCTVRYINVGGMNPKRRVFRGKGVMVEVRKIETVSQRNYEAPEAELIFWSADVLAGNGSTDIGGDHNDETLGWE